MSATSSTGPGYRDLLTRYRRESGLATLLAFFSNFGQTFFISLVLPAMAVSAGLTYTRAGIFYSLATLASAILLAGIGRVSDQVSPRAYAIACSAVFTLAALLCVPVDGPVSLIVGIVLMRWAGQGLLSHASNTILAKRFPTKPGAAFALSSLGFPLGEAILPFLAIAFLAHFPVQGLWGVIAVLSALLLLPASILLGKAFPATPASAEPRLFGTGTATGQVPPSSRPPWEARVWRDCRLWLLLPHFIAVAFTMTGLLFYQSVIGETRGWSPWWWATGLSAFAVVRAVSSLGIGQFLKSRYALPLLVLSKVPILLGCIAIAIPSAPAWTLLLYFPLAGLTLGLQMVVTRTALTELYGPTRIGTAKSASTALIILSTALAPAAYGWIGREDPSALSNGVLFGNVIILLLAVILTQLAMPALRRRASPSH